MSTIDSCKYIVKMGYNPSDPINFDFLMSVPCDGLNRQSPYSMWCVLQMEESLHSIGITTIGQLLDKEFGMLFVHLEVLLPETTFAILRDVIHIIRGGPLLDMRFFRHLRLPQFMHYGIVTLRDIHTTILNALHEVDIVCISSLVELSKSYILYRLDSYETVNLPPMARHVLCDIIDVVKKMAQSGAFAA